MDLTRPVTIYRTVADTVPSSGTSKIVDFYSTEGFSETTNLIGVPGTDGDVIIMLDGGDYPCSLIRMNKYGDYAWYVEAFTTAVSMDVSSDGVIFADQITGPKVHVAKHFLSSGAIDWEVDIDTAVSGSMSSVASAVQSNGNVWVSWLNSSTGLRHTAVLDGTDGSVISDTTTSASKSWNRLVANTARTQVFALGGYGSGLSASKFDTSWGAVGGFSGTAFNTHLTNENWYSAGDGPTGGFFVWFGGKWTGATPDVRVYSIYPHVVLFNANGGQVWTTPTNTYVYPDTVFDVTWSSDLGYVFVYGFDWTQYHTDPGYLWGTLLWLSATSGAVQEVYNVQTDLQYLDTYGLAESGGRVYVGGAVYTNGPEDTYDGLALDPAVGDYGYITGVVPSYTTAADSFELNDATIGSPIHGCKIENVDFSQLEVRQFTEDDGKEPGQDVGGVWLGARQVSMNGTLYGTDRSDLYVRIAAMEAALTPIDGTYGLSTLEWSEPTDTGWGGNWRRLQVRPNGPRMTWEWDAHGGNEPDPLAIRWECSFIAYDPSIGTYPFPEPPPGVWTLRQWQSQWPNVNFPNTTLTFVDYPSLTPGNLLIAGASTNTGVVDPPDNTGGWLPLADTKYIGRFAEDRGIRLFYKVVGSNESLTVSSSSADPEYNLGFIAEFIPPNGNPWEVSVVGTNNSSVNADPCTITLSTVPDKHSLIVAAWTSTGGTVWQASSTISQQVTQIHTLSLCYGGFALRQELIDPGPPPQYSGSVPNPTTSSYTINIYTNSFIRPWAIMAAQFSEVP